MTSWPLPTVDVNDRRLSCNVQQSTGATCRSATCTSPSPPCIPTLPVRRAAVTDRRTAATGFRRSRSGHSARLRPGLAAAIEHRIRVFRVNGGEHRFELRFWRTAGSVERSPRVESVSNLMDVRRIWDRRVRDFGDIAASCRSPGTRTARGLMSSCPTTRRSSPFGTRRSPRPETSASRAPRMPVAGAGSLGRGMNDYVHSGMNVTNFVQWTRAGSTIAPGAELGDQLVRSTTGVSSAPSSGAQRTT